MPAQGLYVARAGGSAKESAMDISRRFYFDYTSAMRIFFHFTMDEGSGSKVNL